MQKYLFWLTWDRPISLLTSILFTFLITLIITSLALVVIGPDGLIGWHTFSQKENIDVVAKTVDIGPFSFAFTEQLIIIKEFLAGGEIPNYPLFKEAALIAILALLALILALISYFNRFGFILFSSFTFFFIIFLHPEMLKIAEVNDYWILTAIFFAFIAPSYYFQSFNKEASFGLRFFVQSLVIASFLGVVVLLSNVTAPLNLLFSYGILAPYLVVLIFIFMVGHEIVNGFILALASGKQDNDNNRIKHFLALSTIYLLNVLISYLQITHVIDWNFVSINPLFLLGFAAIIGVWGISQRFVLYKKVSASQQVWVLLYLAIAILSFTTITYLLISVEDPFIKIISDFIIFSQLAFGFAFLLYVLYNFISVIEKGHSIKGILYKPQNLPHVSYRVLGVAILTALILMRDINYPIWYSLGGYYNSIASYFEEQGDHKIATLFYKKGADLSKYNHKSNYKLGTFLIDDDREKAVEYFSVASSRVPTAQAFVNKANLESNAGDYFNALFTLQKGVSLLPASHQIKNNLGLQFSKANLFDSAWFYLSNSNGYKPAQNNALRFILKNNFSVSAQDSSFLFTQLNKVGRINASALGYTTSLDSSLSVGNMMDGALLNNALVNNLIPYNTDSYMFIVHLLDSVTNEVVAEQLNYALAMYELRNEQLASALERLQALSALGTEKQLRYFELLGLVNLENGAFTRAEEAFILAGEYINSNQPKTYLTPLALAQSEAGYFADAILTWQQVKVAVKEDSVKAEVMIKVLSSILNQNDSIGSNDLNYYLKARYQRLWVDEFAVKLTLAKIQDSSLKNKLALELTSYYFNSGNNDATKLFYDLIKVDDGKEDILEPLLKLNVRLAYGGMVPDLEQQVKKLYEAGFEYGSEENLEKLLFKKGVRGLQENEIELLASQNPFFAEGVVFAAQYVKNDEDGYRSYNVLQHALSKNPDNRLLLEAYIIEAISIGFETYANSSLQHYRALFPGDQFYAFLQKVDRAKAAFNAMGDKET